jgi:hypothetical protein
MRPRSATWTRARRVVAGIAAIGLLAAACSSGEESAETTTTRPPAAPTTTAPPPDTKQAISVPSTTTTSQPPAEAPEPNEPFAEDFADPDSLSRFDFDVHHRDDYVVADTEWEADHSILGPNDLCGPPSEKRVVARGERETDFNSDWIFRCEPGGDPAKAHVMTSIGDTAGYSIGAFSPARAFEDVREIRWDVNISDLGTRQFIEVKVIPVDSFDFQDLPCAVEWLPCETSTHGELGSVGVSFFGHELMINNGTDHESTPWYDDDDPALAEVVTRRQERFTDNGDGTLSFSIERQDGSFQTITAPGRFPDGPVRVVFGDHSYTPTKDEDPIGFTWHWDNIEIDTKESAT